MHLPAVAESKAQSGKRQGVALPAPCARPCALLVAQAIQPLKTSRTTEPANLQGTDLPVQPDQPEPEAVDRRGCLPDVIS